MKLFTVTTFRGRNRKYFWRLKAGNGEIVADSAEGYASKSNARRAWTTVKRGIAGLLESTPSKAAQRRGK
jgi:uncharacterized protein YegP (UPF0339 family)